MFVTTFKLSYTVTKSTDSENIFVISVRLL